ncbi:MAG: hypothetical protein JOZ41_08945, partial [Chloroflexi bacterium]|nr:hypothetical protein [Chloroflexota bacterium]
MRVKDKPTERPDPDAPAWARQLAQRRTARDTAHETAVEQEDWTQGAVTLLWMLFDRAVEQANAALERAGASQRVLLRRTMREYRLSMAGPEGEERQIAVFASLTLVGGRPSGGALITTTTTRATIWLTASGDVEEMRWVIPATGAEL